MKKQVSNVNLKLTPALNPQSASAGTVNGTVIERRNFLSAVANVAIGAVTGSPTATSITYTVQHGTMADGSDMADFDGRGESVITSSAITAANANTSVDIDLEGAHRYIRLVIAVAFTGGTSPAAQLSGSVVLGDPRYTEDI